MGAHVLIFYISGFLVFSFLPWRPYKAKVWKIFGQTLRFFWDFCYIFFVKYINIFLKDLLIDFLDRFFEWLFGRFFDIFFDKFFNRFFDIFFQIFFDRFFEKFVYRFWQYICAKKKKFFNSFFMLQMAT